MKQHIKAQIEELLQEEISQAICNFDSTREEEYRQAFDEFCENILEE